MDSIVDTAKRTWLVLLMRASTMAFVSPAGDFGDWATPRWSTAGLFLRRLGGELSKAEPTAWCVFAVAVGSGLNARINVETAKSD